MIRIGTAGWTVPRAHGDLVGAEGSHLQRYAAVFNATELNSTFYRPHLERTFMRWAESTPDGFQFAVKAPKSVTHTAKLCRCGAELAAFFDNIRPLGPKLGPVLVQLPPKLAFDDAVAHEFFTTFRELHAGPTVVEPRHASWFTPAASRLLRGFDVARAAADPPAGGPAAAEPGGSSHLRYFRLHGSPRKYWSPYDDSFLTTLAKRIRTERSKADVWVIFDNTAGNHALGNALTLHRLCSSSPAKKSRGPLSQAPSP